MRRAKNTEDDSGAEDNGGFESTVSSPSDRAGGIGQEPALGASYRSSMMRVVMLSLLIELLGFTVILPLLPSILEYYSKSDQVREIWEFAFISNFLFTCRIIVIIACTRLCSI